MLYPSRPLPLSPPHRSNPAPQNPTPPSKQPLCFLTIFCGVSGLTLTTLAALNSGRSASRCAAFSASTKFGMRWWTGRGNLHPHQHQTCVASGAVECGQGLRTYRALMCTLQVQVHPQQPQTRRFELCCISSCWGAVRDRECMHREMLCTLQVQVHPHNSHIHADLHCVASAAGGVRSGTGSACTGS